MPLYRDGIHLIKEPRLGGLGYKETKPLPKVLVAEIWNILRTGPNGTGQADNTFTKGRILPAAEMGTDKVRKKIRCCLLNAFYLLVSKITWVLEVSRDDCPRRLKPQE